MRFSTAAILLTATVSVTAAAGCGSKARGREPHPKAAQAPEPAPPTPDTTPIEALRTPAGLVLKLEETPSVTPAASPSAVAEGAKPAR